MRSIGRFRLGTRLCHLFSGHVPRFRVGRSCRFFPREDAVSRCTCRDGRDLHGPAGAARRRYCGRSQEEATQRYEKKPDLPTCGDEKSTAGRAVLRVRCSVCGALCGVRPVHGFSPAGVESPSCVRREMSRTSKTPQMSSTMNSSSPSESISSSESRSPLPSMK